MNQTLVSILVPCHNAEKYVAAAIQSALDQTWPNKEIIVVNDGSTDGSSEALQQFEKRGVKVLDEKFGNASAARNRAYQKSSGDYIKFFDADDLLDPRTIELQMNRLARSTTCVASAEWGRFYGEDFSTFKLNPQSVWRDINSLDWLVEAWMDARPMMQPGLFLIPRAVLDHSGLWDERLTLIDDFEFFARVLCHSEQVLFAPGARLYYRSGMQGSLSGRKSRKAVESAFHSAKMGTSHLLSLRHDEKAKLACANVLQDFIYTYYPEHPDLLQLIAQRVNQLGGSNLLPSGPPRFEKLRKVIGWKLARRLQALAGLFR